MPHATSGALTAPRHGWHAKAIPVVVGFLVTCCYGGFAWWQWRTFQVPSWDLTIFSQLLGQYSRFEAPIVPVKGPGYHLLGDHFHPLLALLAPLYVLAPSPLTLLLTQGALFGLSAGVLCSGALRSIGSWASVALGLSFGLSWGLQTAAAAQFHEIALAVPLLTFSLLALREQRWTTAALWAAPLVFVKEDLGLTVVMIGAIIAFWQPSGASSPPHPRRARVRVRPSGLWLACWGIAWFGIATLLVLPLLNPGGSWAYAGVADPTGTHVHLFQKEKLLTLGLLLLSCGGLALRSPIALVALPTLAWRFVSSTPSHWGPDWHYSAVLMPVVFVALLHAVEQSSRARWRWLQEYSRWGIRVATTVAVASLPWLPVTDAIRPLSSHDEERMAAADTVLRAVPTGASVESDVGLMHFLLPEHTVTWLGNQNPEPECVLIDHDRGGTPKEWGSALQVAARLHPNTVFRVQVAAGDFELVCQRRAAQPPEPSTL